MKKNIIKLLSISSLMIFFMFLGCENNDSLSDSVAIKSITPTDPYQGDVATLKGSGLENVNYVFVGLFDAAFTYNSGVISFKVPNAAPAGKNVVTMVVGDKTRITSEITVQIKPIPTIAVISPSAAAPGENVTITGTNLNNSTTIKVGGVAATVISATATKIVFTVPVVSNNTVASSIALTTTFGTVTSTSTFYASKNLLLNSELELGTGDSFTNWSKMNGGATMFATVVSGEFYSGRALKATGFGSVGGEWRTQFGADKSPTIIGAKYLVYMWIKGSTAAGSMRFSTNATGGAAYGGANTIGTDWKQVTFTFTANSVATGVVLDMGLKTDTYYIDNITMVTQ